MKHLDQEIIYNLTVVVALNAKWRYRIENVEAE
jgi:hypothetical protein